jgi:hypothetical protein
VTDRSTKSWPWNKKTGDTGERHSVKKKEAATRYASPNMAVAAVQYDSATPKRSSRQIPDSAAANRGINVEKTGKEDEASHQSGGSSFVAAMFSNLQKMKALIDPEVVTTHDTESIVEVPSSKPSMVPIKSEIIDQPRSHDESYVRSMLAEKKQVRKRVNPETVVSMPRTVSPPLVGKNQLDISTGANSASILEDLEIIRTMSSSSRHSKNGRVSPSLEAQDGIKRKPNNDVIQSQATGYSAGRYSDILKKKVKEELARKKLEAKPSSERLIKNEVPTTASRIVDNVPIQSQNDVQDSQQQRQRKTPSPIAPQPPLEFDSGWQDFTKDGSYRIKPHDSNNNPSKMTKNNNGEDIRVIDLVTSKSEGSADFFAGKNLYSRSVEELEAKNQSTDFPQDELMIDKVLPTGSGGDNRRQQQLGGVTNKLSSFDGSTAGQKGSFSNDI